MGCLQIFWVKGKKPQGGGRTAPPPPMALRVKKACLDVPLIFIKHRTKGYLLLSLILKSVADPSSRDPGPNRVFIGIGSELEQRLIWIRFLDPNPALRPKLYHLTNECASPLIG